MAYPPSQEDPQGPDPLRSSSEVGVETVREVVAVEDTVHSLAQRGDLGKLIELHALGKIDVNERDSQDVTALHWASINAQIAVCRWLLDNGAEIDAIGGDLRATPLQWASRNGHLYVIHLLLSRGADPGIFDSQGFNSLHLITHSSGVMPLLYMLQQPISVDERDSEGHTSLMWAAYQGDAISVDMLLRHNASVVARDNAGLTPLHWAVVKGNKTCIKRLIESGSDLEARDELDKTPRDMAEELKGVAPYHRALQEAGYTEDGTRKAGWLSERNSKLAVWLFPTVFFFFFFNTLATLPVYTSIPLAFVEFFIMHWTIYNVLLVHQPASDRILNSPYFASIILGSLVWVFYAWVTRLATGTPDHLFAHVIFLTGYVACAYSFYRSVTLDPGHVPVIESKPELREAIEDLASTGRLNGTLWCIACMTKKPLRSKHCRICNRCTARFDHHCPWVYNCVGAGNHREFIMFVTTLITGISAFCYLTICYNENAPPYDLKPSHGPTLCTVATPLCSAAAYDTMLLSITLWAALQLTWTSILLVTQVWQVGRQMTTMEVSNLGKYGFMGGRGGQSLRDQSGAMRQAAAIGAGVGPSGAGEEGVPPMDPHSECDHGRGKHRHGIGACCGKLCAPVLQVLGLDRFTKGKAVSGMARAGRGQNPFDLGVRRNCTEFWSADVDYTRLYELPAEGWAAHRSAAAAAGYQPVSHV